jgi:hypothetical protein
MCGIVGIAGDINAGHRDAFKDLLRVCQVRGRDSTGAFSVNNTGVTGFVKTVGTPEQLLDTKSYDKIVDVTNAKIMVGHCRAKTFGAVTGRNAHPFEHDHILGVHNGTLRGHYNMSGASTFEVDSDFLFSKISKEGVRETIPQMQGAWALVWYDSNEKTLNFLRNAERPLWFGYTEDKKVMIWASEPWMINAFSRDKYKLFQGDPETGEPMFWKLPENRLFSYKINWLGKTPSEIFTLAEPVELASEVRTYTGNVVSSGMNNRGLTGNDWGFRSRNGMGNVTVVDVPDQGGEVADPFSLPDDQLDDIGMEDYILGEGGMWLPSPRLLSQQALTPRADESTNTNMVTIGSPPSSATGSDSKTALTNSTSSGRPRLSLVSPNSSNSPSALRGRPSRNWTERERNSIAQRSSISKTSLRTVAGIDFITDNKTGHEMSSARFEELTDCVCQFCKHPVGDLKEVFEIFLDQSAKTPWEGKAFFLCQSCVTDTSVVA